MPPAGTRSQRQAQKGTGRQGVAHIGTGGTGRHRRNERHGKVSAGTGWHRQAQVPPVGTEGTTGTEMYRQAQGGTKRHQQAQGGTGRHAVADRHKEAPAGTGKERADCSGRQAQGGTRGHQQALAGMG